jgi:hypothetical protein
MPMHRRRVYFDYSSSRKARIEGWLSLSIYVSAGILLLSLLGCLPDITPLACRWLLPERLSDRLGVLSETEHASLLAILCELLLALSGAYLVVALFIKHHTRQGPQ